MFEKFRARIARMIAPPARLRTSVRAYQAAKNSTLTAGWATTTTSADAELAGGLQALRNRSRALVRDAAYAKRAKVIVQNNVIGSGIGMQAQVMSTRGDLRKSVNDAIEEAWRDWSRADTCHTGGTLHFCDLERAVMGQVFEAGEVFVRKHYRPFGDSGVPFALELIEAERIADELAGVVPSGAQVPGAMVRLGVEQDKFGRPIAYWIRQRHPGEARWVAGETDRIERVPADQIIHLRLVDRWPQTRGEPWLHAVARKLNDMDGYSEAEIIAARASAQYVFSIETPEGNNPLATPGAEGEKSEMVLEPGMTARLAPGEALKAHSPSRPNTALDPFMRYMLREVAAGAGVSYESLSRDYSQSNFSSSRLALLDDRDLWRMLQQWFIRNFRWPLHNEWLNAAVLSGEIPAVDLEEFAVDMKKFQAVLFKPRGWSWIDPTKEVAAYKEAVRAGFTTVADVIAATAGGQDIEDVLRQRERELEMMDEAGLVFDTSPEFYMQEVAALPAPAPPPADPADDDDDDQAQNPPRRVFSFGR